MLNTERLQFSASLRMDMLCTYLNFISNIAFVEHLHSEFCLDKKMPTRIINSTVNKDQIVCGNNGVVFAASVRPSVQIVFECPSAAPLPLHVLVTSIDRLFPVNREFVFAGIGSDHDIAIWDAKIGELMLYFDHRDIRAFDVLCMLVYILTKCISTETRFNANMTPSFVSSYEIGRAHV